jgi:ATP-dependent DNA ligase
MRLSRRSEPFDSDQFIYELKIDGFRALAHIQNGEGELVSRNGNINCSEAVCVLYHKFI